MTAPELPPAEGPDAVAKESVAKESASLPPTVLEPELLAELPVFEQFFKTFGFKRIHGRVWGLLVLSERPLSSREISEQLGISQGATSTTLSELNEWGALSSSFDSSRRCHLHGPVGNALSIAATILRRREQVAFQAFQGTADRALEFIRERHGDRDPRVLTLRSIISACEIADALMKLLVGAVANALGDSQSILSRAIAAAFKVGLGGAPRALFANAPAVPKSLPATSLAPGEGTLESQPAEDVKNAPAPIRGDSTVSEGTDQEIPLEPAQEARRG